MNRSCILALIGFLLFLLVACERPARLDLGVLETEVVVLANFSDLDTLEVVLSVSQPVTGGGHPEYISDAVVDLFVDGFIADRLEYVTSPIPQIPGYYLSNKIVPEPGAHYRVRVDAPGFEEVEGSSTMPFPVSIDPEFTRVAIQKEQLDAQNTLVTIAIDLKVLDPSGPNYYHLSLYQEGYDFEVDPDGDTIKTSFFSLPLVMEAEDDAIPLVPYLDSRGTLFSDEALEVNRGELSFTCTFQFRPQDQLLGDLLVELRSTSPEYFFYHRSLARQYQAGQDPFSEPVILYSNIQGGQGIFAGFIPRFYRVEIGE